MIERNISTATKIMCYCDNSVAKCINIIVLYWHESVVYRSKSARTREFDAPYNSSGAFYVEQQISHSRVVSRCKILAAISRRNKFKVEMPTSRTPFRILPVTFISRKTLTRHILQPLHLQTHAVFITFIGLDEHQYGTIKMITLSSVLESIKSQGILLVGGRERSITLTIRTLYTITTINRQCRWNPETRIRSESTQRSSSIDIRHR